MKWRIDEWNRSALCRMVEHIHEFIIDQSKTGYSVQYKIRKLHICLNDENMVTHRCDRCFIAMTSSIVRTYVRPPLHVCQCDQYHTSLQHTSLNINPMQKWLPLNYSFVHNQNSPTNLVFETKILKNLLSRTRLVGLFWIWTKRQSLNIHVLINWHLLKQGIRWPVSRGDIAGSSLELIDIKNKTNSSDKHNELVHFDYDLTFRMCSTYKCFKFQRLLLKMYVEHIRNIKS